MKPQRIIIAGIFILFSILSYGQERPKMNRFFTITPTSAIFDAEGGTKTFSINASGSWNISSLPQPWGHLTKNGDKLTLKVDSNSETTSRIDSFELTSGDKKIVVSYTQSGQVVLNVSQSNLSFDSSGGTKTITISSSTGSWEIGTSTTSWGHLTKDGDRIKVTIDKNTGSTSRSDWFTVKAGNKEQRINISQSASSNVRLSLSDTNLSFSASGGSQTITVTTNSTWSIGTDAASWGHLTKQGNKLIVQIDPHSGTNPRTDWFSVKSGDKEVKVNISQSANSPSSSTTTKSATIHNVAVSNNADVDGEKGLSIKVTFNITGMKGKNGDVTCYFYDSDGNALLDKNHKYYTNDSPSHVAVRHNITPPYDNTKYTECELKIPYSELHLTDNTIKTLRVDVIIWDDSVSPSTSLAKKSNTSFSYSPSVDYLRVNGSTSNLTQSFPSYGGRKTFNVSTSATNFDTWGVPTWCSIENKTSNSFTLACSSNPYSTSRSDYMKIKAAGKEIRIDISQEGKQDGKKVKTHSDPWFRIGLDVSMDILMSNDSYSYYDSYYYDYYNPYYSSYDESSYKIYFAAGLRARIGRPDHFLNLISGARYVFAGDFSGIMVPAILNLNLIRGDNIALYIGGGYEFAATGEYESDAIIQTGLCGKHADLQVYYRPSSNTLGAGFTLYF